nr:hypothetical protein Q903MT_gene5128 [Picea sitchensis]
MKCHFFKANDGGPRTSGESLRVLMFIGYEYDSNTGVANPHFFIVNYLRSCIAGDSFLQIRQVAA